MRHKQIQEQLDGFKITKLLARVNGDIGIVSVKDTKASYLVLQERYGERSFKVFTAEQGIKWELFDGVDKAIEWITEQNKPKAKKIKLGTREWNRREREVIDSYCPQIVSCSNCGSPRIHHLLCQYCHKE